MVALALLAALLPTALAVPLTPSNPLDTNLVYQSPYTNDKWLAIDTHSVHKRHLEAGAELMKRDQLAATPLWRHLLGKRQSAAAQVVRPQGAADTYTLAGYGGAVTFWDDATYIYSGPLNFSESKCPEEIRQMADVPRQLPAWHPVTHSTRRFSCGRELCRRTHDRTFQCA